MSATSTRRVPERRPQIEEQRECARPEGEGNLRHPLMVGAKHIEFTGNFTLLLSNAPGAMKDFSFISGITNEKLCECGVL